MAVLAANRVRILYSSFLFLSFHRSNVRLKALSELKFFRNRQWFSTFCLNILFVLVGAVAWHYHFDFLVPSIIWLGPEAAVLF